ncbi:Transposon Ty3-G Gag-Pol poly [Labeo rohita]|uniref:Gypsy retrotransposon integrase-like protein 1 n=1 Tax=Labeo rohita TaxID=84645 RepID=A0A498NMB5_LABRO|nr:Transposon Ty3-G Gag-Pol poly [Labeo rohita]
MSQMLEGLEGVLCHMDDILVFGVSQTEHDECLFSALQKKQKGGLTVKQKCKFSKKSVKFLGQILDESGVHADPEKIRERTLRLLMSSPEYLEKKEETHTNSKMKLNLYVNLLVTSLTATEKRLHEIQQHQEADPILQLVKKYSLEGWPTKSRVEAMVQPYFQFAGELTVENGLLLKGCRLVIPKSLQSDILEKLHNAPQGIAKCRERSKQSVWWPGLSTQLQQKVEKCEICASHRKNFKETLIPTEFPERPWTKVGADLFQWKNDQYLLVKPPKYQRDFEHSAIGKTE